MVRKTDGTGYRGNLKKTKEKISKRKVLWEEQWKHWGTGTEMPRDAFISQTYYIKIQTFLITYFWRMGVFFRGLKQIGPMHSRNYCCFCGVQQDLKTQSVSQSLVSFIKYPTGSEWCNVHENLKLKQFPFSLTFTPVRNTEGMHILWSEEGLVWEKLFLSRYLWGKSSLQVFVT